MSSANPEPRAAKAADLGNRPPFTPDQVREELATVLAGAPGALGVAQLVLKEGGVTFGRPLFDAGTPVLPGFAPPARFTF